MELIYFIWREVFGDEKKVYILNHCLRYKYLSDIFC